MVRKNVVQSLQNVPSRIIWQDIRNNVLDLRDGIRYAMNDACQAEDSVMLNGQLELTPLRMERKMTVAVQGVERSKVSRLRQLPELEVNVWYRKVLSEDEAIYGLDSEAKLGKSGLGNHERSAAPC